MKYTTTTSRRVVMVKIKTRPGQDRSGPTALRNPPHGKLADRVAVPELFARSSPVRVAVAPLAPWWSNWKAILLTLGLLVALLGAILLVPKSDGRRENRAPSVQPQPAAVTSQTLQMRPMGMASGSGAGSAPSAMPGGLSQGGGGLSAGRLGAALSGASEGQLSVSRGRSEASYSARAGEIDQALQDGGRKLVLPADVAGNCNLGEAGSKGLSACLARNGARAE